MRDLAAQRLFFQYEGMQNFIEDSGIRIETCNAEN